MPLDTIFLSRLIEETAPTIVGARIDKIHQTARLEVVLALRGEGGTNRLLLSARPGAARLNLTEQKRENPNQPPMFCMLLRKHLSGGRILSLTQVPGERIVRLAIESQGELGETRRRALVLEAMGQQTNLILLDHEERIVDALRRVDGDITTGKRQILPGLFYRLPDPVEKPDALSLSAEQLEQMLLRAPREARLADVFRQEVGGLSPLVCRELAHRAGDVDIRLEQIDVKQVSQQFQRVIQEEKNPTCVFLSGEPKDFSFLDIEQYGTAGESRHYPTFAALLEDFYGNREQRDLLRQKGETLRTQLERSAARLQRKMAAQQRELLKATEREELRIFGDLVTSNLHQMEKGESRLVCENYYHPDGGEITIKLDPLKTPQQNAAYYYKSYTRMKTAQEMLTQQLASGEEEVEYITSVLDALARARSEGDIADIRAELTQHGYLKAQTGKKRQKVKPQPPLEFTTSTGRRVLVGRNNLQNEQLTFRVARHTDIWLHVHKAPGSHVILECDSGMPDDASLEEAAALAVEHSSLAKGSKAAVDYSPVRNLKKTPSGKPGMVIYHKYWTLTV